MIWSSSNSDLQITLRQFAAECEAAGLMISTSKSEAMVFIWKRVDCPLEVELLSQVQEFKYVGVVHKWGENGAETDRQIEAASVVVQTLYWSVVVKKELNQKATLSIYWIVYSSNPNLWPGNASAFSLWSWWKWPGRRRSGLSYCTCSRHDPELNKQKKAKTQNKI